MKIVILNSKTRFRDEDVKKLESAGAIFYEQKGNKLEDIKELYGDEDLVLGVQPGFVDGVWSGLPWEKLKELKTLKGLCLSTTAYGWVPFKELGEKGIPVCNVPGKSTDAVAEYYVFMMTALLRKMPSVMRNNWTAVDGKKEMGVDAFGLTVGIIGLGSIGRKLADLCAGYGMKVKYWGRSKKDCPYEYVELDNLCKQSDVMFLSTVSDDSTKGLIDQRRIDLMKSTAIFLSPVDVLVYDKKYMVEKIGEGELGGLGFETDEERLSDYKGNIFPAPEIAYYTQQTMDKESRIMTESILSIANCKPINVVNL